jgi:hypothetical protein
MASIGEGVMEAVKAPWSLNKVVVFSLKSIG